MLRLVYFLLIAITFINSEEDGTCSADSTSEACVADESSEELEERSTPAANDNSLNVAFVNQASKPADLYWLNGNKKVFHASIMPGKQLGMNTYISHRFTATPKDYRATLKTYTMERGKTKYYITQDMFDRLDSNDCIDRVDTCRVGRNSDRCENGWMIVNCAKSCNDTSDRRDYCALRDPKIRCQPEFLNLTMNNNLKPGELSTRIQDIVTNPAFEQFSPHLVWEDPPVVQFDSFLTDAQCDALFSTTGPFERSTDTGAKNALGEAKRVISKTRTSQNAWCRHRCETNPHVKQIIQNVEDITRVPKINFEAPQVLRYESGQFYRPHLDRGHSNTDNTLSGGRIFTFFLYCSDVEEGGATNFPRINRTGLAVFPKRGRAILWPSVKNMDPTGSADSRTLHEAQDVKKGIKLAANVWIHQRNFKIPNEWGCTGAFD